MASGLAAPAGGSNRRSEQGAPLRAGAPATTSGLPKEERQMFIQTEDTPNPQSMKFLPGRPVLGAGALGMDFPNAGTAKASPLAQTLFNIDGVAGVFLGADFVTVTKYESTDWRHVKPAILGAIADFLTAALPILAEDAGPARKPATSLDDYEEEDREIVEQIIELIDTRVRPAVAADGGDIVFQHYEPRTGVVFLSLHGSCSGCPSSTMTLKAGIENMLKHYVPEVLKVEAVA
jgi:Fe-S cluster biogenesis protein NfuA